MSVFDFRELLHHEGHEIVCVSYRDRYSKQNPKIGRVWNVALECETCNKVLIDFDNPDKAGEA